MTSTDLDGEERAELDRLRRLVGPSEVAYGDLRRDLTRAERAARDALAEVGEWRGRHEEYAVQLARARQDQDLLLQRSALSPVGQVIDRTRHRWHTSVVPRLARVASRIPGRRP